MDYTNQPEWFNRLGLDPTKHELWWLENNWTNDLNEHIRTNFSNLSPDKKHFIFSCEGRVIPIEPRENVYLFDSVIDDSKHIVPWMTHWHQTVWIEQNIVKTPATKTENKLYDALLGQQREHRDFVFEYLQSKPKLYNQGIVTYYKNADGKNNFISPYDTSNFTHSSDQVLVDTEYSGKFPVPFSKIVPDEIYANSKVSVVAETCSWWFDEHQWPTTWSHYTEKIVKPMLAKRPFVVVANQGYLKRLRDIGFKTFDNFVDESYDQIENNHERWKNAINQLERFATIPADKYQDVVKHNYQLLTNTSWTNDVDNYIKKIAFK